MRPEHLVVDESCLRRLGENGLYRVAAALHPARADCQTCVRPLAGIPTSLTIDNVGIQQNVHSGPVAVARLHHADCRRSGWNDGPLVVLQKNASTYSKTNFLVTGPETAPEDRVPVVVLNPGLDMVFLGQVNDHWTPVLPDRYRQTGMAHNSEHGERWSQEVSGIIARILPDNAIQIVGPHADDLYDETGGHPAPQEMVDAAGSLGRLLFAVTLAVNPIDIDTAVQLQRVLDHPLTLVGDVRVER